MLLRASRTEDEKFIMVNHCSEALAGKVGVKQHIQEFPFEQVPDDQNPYRKAAPLLARLAHLRAANAEKFVIVNVGCPEFHYYSLLVRNPPPNCWDLIKHVTNSMEQEFGYHFCNKSPHDESKSMMIEKLMGLGLLVIPATTYGAGWG
jgi:hypothetical protein